MTGPGDEVRHEAQDGAVGQDIKADSEEHVGSATIEIATKEHAGSAAHDVAAQQRSTQPSWAHLPPEIITLIFENIELLRGRIRLSQVCRSFRERALNMPRLWEKVYEEDGSEWMGDDSTYYASLLAMCDERTGSTLKHANLKTIHDAETLRNSLELLQRSRESLVGISLSEHTSCNCRNCHRHPVLGQDRARTVAEAGDYHFDLSRMIFPLFRIHAHSNPRVDVDAQEVILALFDLLRKTRRLEYFEMEFTWQHGFDFLAGATRFKPNERDAMAHPKRMSLTGPQHCCPHLSRDAEPLHTRSRIRETQIMAFFDELASEVTTFTFDAAIVDDERDWLHWAWRIMVRRAEYLEHLCIPLGPLAHFQRFPVLTQAVFTPCVSLLEGEVLPVFPGSLHATGHASNPQYWFAMPALRTLVSTPSIAAKLYCPLVGMAHLHLRYKSCVELLPLVLRSWPELWSLTLSLDLDGALGGLGEHILDATILMLTPSKVEYGLCHKLRHLGIRRSLQSDHTACAAEGQLEWAHVPWSEKDLATWKLIPYQDGQMPQLPSQIKAMVSERGDHLESIKMAGLYVAPDMWRDLVGTASAKLSCYPDPLSLEYPDPA